MREVENGWSEKKRGAKEIYREKERERERERERKKI